MADRRFELSDLDAEWDDLENRALAAKAKLKRAEALNAELLAALEGMVDVVGCQPGYVSSLALKQAVAAIAKARGEA